MPMVSIGIVLFAQASLLFSTSPDQEVREWMQRRGVPGASYAVASPRGFELVGGVGTANLEDRVGVQRATIFAIGSVTKPWATFLVHLSVERGELSWDDELSKYLPDVRPDWSGVTLRRLASHTAGVPDTVLGALFGTPKTRDQLVQEALSKPLGFEPGTAGRYSNSGFMLLARALEARTGTKFEDHLRSATEAIGLWSTAITSSDPEMGLLVPHQGRVTPQRIAQGYSRQGANWTRVQLKSPAVALGAGGISSTALDLVRFGQHLLRLQRERKGIDKMWTPVPFGTNPGDYGLGWSIDTVNGRRCVSHSGAMPGFSAHLAIYPDDEVIVAVLANVMSGNPREVARELAARYLAKPSEPGVRGQVGQNR